MILIVAAAGDGEARTLAERWSHRDARLLTCQNLAQPGWQLRLGRGTRWRAVVGGVPVEPADLDAVLVRMPWVSEAELPHIHADDRGYVAAELNAFLIGWLSVLECRVLNRPSATCLGGPGWRLEQWMHTAARLDIPVRDVHRAVTVGTAGAPPPADELVTVTVVGGRAVEHVDPQLAKRACRLAEHADVELLAAAFSVGDADTPLVDVDCWPPLRAPAIIDAVAARLGGFL